MKSINFLKVYYIPCLPDNNTNLKYIFLSTWLSWSATHIQAHINCENVILTTDIHFVCDACICFYSTLETMIIVPKFMLPLISMHYCDTAHVRVHCRLLTLHRLATFLMVYCVFHPIKILVDHWLTVCWEMMWFHCS